MTIRIHSETTEQQGSDYVYAMVNAIVTGPGPGRMIGDSIAVSIAAWWQSPGTIGRAFAELASTGSVDYDDIINDIERTYPEADNNDDRYALMALFVWAVNKARE